MRIRGKSALFIRINAKLDRIASELESSTANLSRLASRNRDGDLDEIISRETGLTLHNIYNGIEQILEDVARDIDGGQPSGMNSHSDLIDQLQVETYLRPAVVGKAIFDDVKDLMKFRHAFRHGYGMSMRAFEIAGKYAVLSEKVLPEFLRSLQALSDHLDADPDVSPDRDALDAGPP
jgi:hypothetical protein